MALNTVNSYFMSRLQSAEVGTSVHAKDGFSQQTERKPTSSRISCVQSRQALSLVGAKRVLRSTEVPGNLSATH